jgi:putative endopeptidase
VVRNIPEFYDTFGVTGEDELWLAPEQRVKIW